MHEATVHYAGPPRDGLTPGTRGRVLSRTALYGHVRWLEGPCKGQVGLYPTEDLQSPSVPHSASLVDDSLRDSLEVGPLISLASAEEAYDSQGPEGLLDHLISTGHLASYASHAEDALTHMADLLEADPLLHRLTAHMDPDEAQMIYRTAARQLLTDERNG